jgi:tRNA(fMet)-specific endonuclease VapC
MTNVKLLADTNVISYMFRGSPLGDGYTTLIGGLPTGITLLSLAELHYGIALNQWGDAKLRSLNVFLTKFSLLPGSIEISELCGHLRAQRERVGRRIELADAWIAATALWFDIPVVTHDRDLEAIPGLRVRTLHNSWTTRTPDRWGEWQLPLGVGSGPHWAENANRETR